MKITMIGHAGALIETSAGGILVDPWLFGSAFNNSWDLLEPSYIPTDLWDRVNWIWFSHEHPDHFHPASIRSIPEGKRNSLQVLFQTTRDRKVINWLISHGFNVKEINHGSYLRLGPKACIYLECVAIYDSWLMIKDGDKCFLDLNDCSIVPYDLQRISKLFPTVDVLLTQFSFAGWIGNPRDHNANLKAAEEYLKKLYDQVAAIKPLHVIPAASFIRFSHVDNAWMNEFKATVPRAVVKIEIAGSNPIVLKPGDRWDISEPWDNTSAIQHYNLLFTDNHFALHSHQSIDTPMIIQSATNFSARIRSHNNILLLCLLRLILGFLRPIVFWLTDLQLSIRVDPLAGAVVMKTLGSEDADISLHSFVLLQLLSQPSGIDTLIVSGLFQTIKGDITKLHNSFNVMSLNNAGIEIKFVSLFSLENIKKLVQISLPWYQWKKGLRKTKKLRVPYSEKSTKGES